jgi:hypothetical protein
MRTSVSESGAAHVCGLIGEEHADEEVEAKVKRCTEIYGIIY